MPKKTLACQVSESWHTRVRAAVEKSGGGPISEWLRGLVANEVVRVEAMELSEEGGDTNAPMEVQLAAAHARIEGLEELVAAHRERLTESQAHILDIKTENEGLHKHLSETNSNVERMTLMLPAAGGASTGGAWWKLWWG